jgi:hypothetical protein
VSIKELKILVASIEPSHNVGPWNIVATLSNPPSDALERQLDRRQ